ncbi:hypothetical protein FJ942_17575 [Mesorhizobium sp. B2-4-2]|uniref:hypothetical protein n=1 Tax=Mesorhizobium sp. B2-4-2 TaxID=2589947 RepID=UPI00112A56BC|nr:hypothetical protein [Mesorhizobium sp. B2-4-2]TPL55506.1 hypothetical protein FJ942_17575 [Mesorhizobium sp. B2-4-2]
MAVISGRKGADFKPSTVRTIAERANLRCVVPGCPTPTSGPGATPQQVALTGTACHIYSAGVAGPRGRGGLSVEQLSCPENGVWACATHGRLIDTNAGAAYPADLLKGWKQLQEAQLRREQDGQLTTVGWLGEIVVQKSFLFEKDTRLELGQFTLLEGASYGKTAICDWLSAVLGEELPHRWAIPSSPILTSVVAFVPEKRRLDGTFDHGVTKLVIDGVPVVEVPKMISVVYLRESAGALLHRRGGEDDERIAANLGLSRAVLRGLVPDIQRNGTTWGRDLAFYDEPKYLGEDEEGEDLHSDSETEVTLRLGGPNGVALGALSGSEKVRVLLEFACALARERARRGPTVLMLEGTEWPFDHRNMDACGAFLSQQPCQVLLTVGDNWEPKTLEPWYGWSRYRVSKGSGGSRVERLPWSEVR